MERVPSDHLIVPVDDDDWFAPDLAECLRREYDPGVRGYLWACHVIEPPRRIRSSLRRIARLLGRRDRFICGTNDYAVVNAPGLRHLALNHVQASRHFDARPSDIKRIPATLAIQNRTLASQTTLAWDRPSIRREELIILLSRYRDLYSSWKLPPSLSWAKPYIDMMAELSRAFMRSRTHSHGRGDLAPMATDLIRPSTAGVDVPILGRSVSRPSGFPRQGDPDHR